MWPARREDAGVTLVLELLNSKVDHPDYQCDRTTWGLQVIERVGSPRVRLLYDIYHMQVMEGDLMRTIQAHHGAIGHYHVAGNPGRHEPDRSQEISYPAIYEAIATTDFEGYVGMEYIPRGGPVASLRAALDDFRDRHDLSRHAPSIPGWVCRRVASGEKDAWYHRDADASSQE